MSVNANRNAVAAANRRRQDRAASDNSPMGRMRNRAPSRLAVLRVGVVTQFECETDKGFKVWQVQRLSDSQFQVAWGRQGGSLRTKTHKFTGSKICRSQLCSQAIMKLVRAKRDKGYDYV